MSFLFQTLRMLLRLVDIYDNNLAVPGTLTHHLHCRTAWNTQPSDKSKIATTGPQNGQWGLESGLNQGYLTL